MDLLDEKQQKQLYDEAKDKINTAYLYSEQLKDNQNSLLDTIKELLVTGGIDKVKALRDEVVKQQTEINWYSIPAAGFDNVTQVQAHEVSDTLRRLLSILDTVIANDSLDNAYTLMFLLSTGANDQIAKSLGDDNDNDNDGNDDADPVFN